MNLIIYLKSLLINVRAKFGEFSFFNYNKWHLGGIRMSNELMINNENLYLLYGEIPVDRICIMEGTLNSRESEEEFVKDLRGRFYTKNKCGTDGFMMNSATQDLFSDDDFFMGFADNDVATASKSFMGLREFLAKAKFVGRTFRPNPEDFSAFEGRPISEIEYDMVVNDKTRYELVCVLGNVAIIKRDAILTSGYSVVDLRRTPLVGNEYVFIKGEEPKQYDREEIVKGIENDVQSYFDEMTQDCPVEGQIINF